jgi:hypothetical protein
MTVTNYLSGSNNGYGNIDCDTIAF